MSSSTAIHPGPSRGADPLLGTDRLADREVRELMSPGVTCISEDASLDDVQRAMLGRGVHAILVVGLHGGAPLGWVTSRGLLGFVDRDRSLTSAKQAVVEPVTTISPTATGREALHAISRPGVTHLLVTRAADRWPLGVISDVDLVGLAAR